MTKAQIGGNWGEFDRIQSNLNQPNDIDEKVDETAQNMLRLFNQFKNWNTNQPLVFKVEESFEQFMWWLGKRV